jgi:hypothetical protein
MIDYSKVDYSDPMWWVRINMVLSELDRRDRMKAMELALLRDLTVVSSPYANEMGILSVAHQIGKTINGINKLIFQGSYDPEAEEKALVDELTAAWENEWGPLGDRITEAAIDEAVSVMNARAAKW